MFVLSIHYRKAADIQTSNNIIDSFLRLHLFFALSNKKNSKSQDQVEAVCSPTRTLLLSVNRIRSTKQTIRIE
jgi:hypothetical protein